MSRIGKKVATLPSGVEASVNDKVLTVKGPKGTLTRTLHDAVGVNVADGTVTVAPTKDTDDARALWGTFAAHVHNMVHGVSEGFTKVLEIEGVGYRAEVKGNGLVLNVGFSHPVELTFPEGVTGTVEKNVITLTGADKEVLGQYAADVRKVRKPEPYKGKGIRYQGEYIIRKQGKKAV
jgi:large subunit ribosomal protein L6